jgi:hypothetical protein
MVEFSQAEIKAVTGKQERLIDESMKMGLGKYATGMNVILTRIIEASLEVEKDPEIKKGVRGVFLPVQEALSRAAEGYNQVPLVEMEATTVMLKANKFEALANLPRAVEVQGGKKSCGLRGGFPHCFEHMSEDALDRPWVRGVTHIITIALLTAAAYYAIPALARLPGALSRFLQGAAYLPTLCTGDLLNIWWTDFMATWYSHWFPGGNAPISQTCVQRMAAWVSVVNFVVGVGFVVGVTKMVKDWWKGVGWMDMAIAPLHGVAGIYRCLFNGVLAVLMVFLGGHVQTVGDFAKAAALAAGEAHLRENQQLWIQYNDDFNAQQEPGGYNAYMEGWEKAQKAQKADAEARQAKADAAAKKSKGGRKTRRHKRKSRKTKSHKKRSSRRRHKRKTSKGKKARKH